jgi:hypothetical protein
MFVLAVTAISRAVVGILMLYGVRLWAVSALYPFRVAFPNYALLLGLPYALSLVAVTVFWSRILDIVSTSRWRLLLLWALSCFLSVNFGALHGGLISGNLGIATASDHLHDALINPTFLDTFATHIARVRGAVSPQYLAPHSFSHPAGSIAYWQLAALNLPGIAFSLLNAALFALSFPMLNSALERQIGNNAAVSVTVATMVTPALLIYGRSDDAVYYFVSTAAVSLMFLAVYLRSYWRSGAAAVFLGISMNLSYASATLLPTMFAMTSNVTISPAVLWRYVRDIFGAVLIVASIVCVAIVAESLVLKFDYFSGLAASASHAHDYTFAAVLRTGEYVRAFNDRIMTILDFALLGGPLFLFVYLDAVRNLCGPFQAMRLKNVALGLLLIAIVVQMASAGETARDWGSLYPIMGLCFLPDLVSQMALSERLWVIRAQFIWSLLLEALINFSW